MAASPAVARPARTASVILGTAPPTVNPGSGVPKDWVKEFLFPGDKSKPFPDNPSQPLLNPLFEKSEASSLPNRGETAEEFFTRLQQSDLFKKANLQADTNPITPWNTGPAYPRGKYPVVDAAVDQALQQIDRREATGLQNACRRAVMAMDAEFAQMEKQGIIRDGDDLGKEEQTDVAYENALMAARHRVYAQLEKDVGATLVAATMPSTS